MFLYLTRRLGLTIVVLFIVSVIIFSLVNIIPGDPAVLMLGTEASPEALEALRVKMGLNDPLYVQYFNWVSGVVRGDLGNSLMDNTEVTGLLMQKVPVTIQLTLMGILVATIISIPAGIVAATRKGTMWDYGSTFFALSGLSIPPFFLAILLIYIFSVVLGWLPPSGYVSPMENLGKSILLMLMPAFSVGVRLSAELMRMMRSQLLEVLKSDYIRTAYSKGLLEKSVVIGHALRNALIPVITISGLQLSALMGGAIITEVIFSIPGIGQLMINSILTRDYPVVQGSILFLAFAVIIINFVVDIIYTLLDPRIRLTGGE